MKMLVDRESLEIVEQPTFFSMGFEVPEDVARKAYAMQRAASDLRKFLSKIQRGPVSGEQMTDEITNIAAALKSSFNTADRTRRRNNSES